MPLLSSGERDVLIETIRALGRIGDPAAAEPLLRLISDAATDPHVRLEAVGALGGIRIGAGDRATRCSTCWPIRARRSAPRRCGRWPRSIRRASSRCCRGSIPIRTGASAPRWRRCSATLPPEVGLPRLRRCSTDTDQRVIPAVLAALVKLKAPNAAALLLERLKADDPVVRAAAATALGELKPANGAAALAEAYRFGQRDATLRRARRGARGARDVRRRRGRRRC